MHAVHAEVSRFLLRAAVGRGVPILVAVSGGADSVALLCALAALGQRLGAAHVHHGLRGAEADADAEAAAAVAGRLGAPFHLARVDARRPERPDGHSPEERARVLRYAALDALARQHGYAHLATAHTRDDLAETLLLRAARGTGVRGLAAITPTGDGGRLLRPLLRVRGAALRSYLRARGIDWREDQSNRDLAVPRNRVRLEAMPALERAHPGAARQLASLAERVAGLGSWLEQQLDALLLPALDAADGGVWLERSALEGVPEPLRLDALARWLERAGVWRRVAASHLERLDAFSRTALPGRRMQLPGGGVFADRTALWAGTAREPRFPGPLDRTLAPGSELLLPERRVRIACGRARPADSGRERLRLPVPVTSPGGLRLRSPRPGDCMRTGPGKARPLREVLARAQWSQREKAYALLVTDPMEPVAAVLGAVGAGRPPLRAWLPRERRAGGWELRVEPLSTPAGSC